MKGSQQGGKIGCPLLTFLFNDNNLAAYMDKIPLLELWRIQLQAGSSLALPRTHQGSCPSEPLEVYLPTFVPLKILKRPCNSAVACSNCSPGSERKTHTSCPQNRPTNLGLTLDLEVALHPAPSLHSNCFVVVLLIQGSTRKEVCQFHQRLCLWSRKWPFYSACMFSLGKHILNQSMVITFLLPHFKSTFHIRLNF